jgi:hypothetical protein
MVENLVGFVAVLRSDRSIGFDIRFPDLLSTQLIILCSESARWSGNEKGETMEIVNGIHDLAIVLALTGIALLPRAAAAYLGRRD